MYSGGTSKFVEENTFGIIIPIENVPELQVDMPNVHYVGRGVQWLKGNILKNIFCIYMYIFS